MTERPYKIPGTRMCLCLTHEGLTAYGNRESFAALGQYMRWLENSNSDEHYECHVTMSFESDASMFEGQEPRNVWVLLSRQLAGHFPVKSLHNPGFELTFMMVPEADLDKMERYQVDGLLPDDWNRAEG